MVSFDNGLTVWLPEMPTAESAEKLAKTVKDWVEKSGEGDANIHFRQTLQAIQTTGGHIHVTILDDPKNDKYSIIANNGSLFKRWVKESIEY